MKKIALFAVAAVAVSGCDFAGGAGVLLPAASLEVSNLPATNGQASWDADGAPDVVVEIQNAAGRAVFASEVLEDFDVSQPLRVTVGGEVEVPFSTMQMTVAVYDVDTSVADSQLMTRSARFSVEDLAGATELQLEPQVGGASFSVRRSQAPTAE
jgi:hypothetical protein